MPSATDADRNAVLLDTSAGVALIVEDHEAHESTLSAVRGRRLGLSGHAWFETYSVLTRLPAPHRIGGLVVREFLQARFPRPFLRLAAPAYRAFVLGLADAGIVGGAAYDALVAATAAGFHAELVTCDRRALPVYERYGVRTRLLP